MSFEPLISKLFDRRGHQVAESIQTTVVRAFERAIAIPDANVDDLVSGAARVARVIADGGAKRPEEYASNVLRRIAFQSQRNFLGHAQTASLSDHEVHSLEGNLNSSSSILAGIEIRQLLASLGERDRKIVMMRSRGFRYEEIAADLGMPSMSVRCRHCLVKRRLQKIGADKR